MVKTLGVDLDKYVVTCEIPYGGALFINNCVPMGVCRITLIRYVGSLDLRWQDPSKPTVSR